MRSLTALEKWSYAIGNMPYAVKDAAFVNFVIFYYTQVQGLSGSLAGLSAFIALSWDAISDPIVGSWSDTVRTRWGRRHPLILLGGIPFALMFLLVFSPPQGLGQFSMFLWLTVVAVLLRTFLTIYFIPYSAMGAELSTDYDERTVIAKARVTMSWIAGMALPAIAFTVFFESSDISDGRLIAENYHAYGVFSALVAAITIVVCVWGTRTMIDRLPQSTSSVSGLSLRRTVDDFKLALTNRNFRMTVGTNLAFGMASGVYVTLALYMGTYFWEFSSDQLAGLVVPMALGTVLAFSLVARLGARFDKATLMAACSLGIMFNAIWFTGLRLLDLLPENGHPVIYPLQILNTVLGVFTIAGLQMLGISLLADILDEQELNTGLRQEGVFFAASTFVQKATTGVGALVAGVVVDMAGIAAGSQPGEVPERTLQLLGWFFVSITGVLAFIAFVYASRVRLGRQAHAQVRQRLNAQQATTAAAAVSESPPGL